jgi:hypothetical protein
MSPDILNTLGKNVDYYYDGKASGYIAAYNAAQGSYPAGFSNLQDPLDASYYDGASNQSDLMGYLKADIAVTDRLRWVTTAYGHGERIADDLDLALFRLAQRFAAQRTGEGTLDPSLWRGVAHHL